MPAPSARFLAAVAAAPPHPRFAPRVVPAAPAPVALRFVIPGSPCPWARAGHHGRVTFTPHRQRDWMGRARTAMRYAMFRAGHRAPLSVPLAVEVVAFWPRPASRGMGPDCWRPSHPDIDNAAKIVLDAGNDVLWLDDRQVVRLVVEKRVAGSGEDARVEVSVEPVA